ncbi:MAG TPA: glycosyltransferase family 39 protein [bacterium]|nr:glycosyltransferase family 39 protein [bacterium]
MTNAGRLGHSPIMEQMERQVAGVSVDEKCPAGIPHALSALILAGLLLKLSLIGWNRGEYTDGIIQLQLWDSPIVFFPPLYTLVVRFVNLFVGDLLTSGRLVSIVSSALVPIPLFLAARRLGDDSIGILASLLWFLSPMQNRWGLRVMTDSLFVLLFTVALLYYVHAILDRGAAGNRALRGTFFWAGLATLTRYHGLVFLLLWLPLVRWRIQFRPRRREGEPEPQMVRFSWPLALVFIPWIGLVLWLAIRGFGHFGQFTERASHGLFVTLLTYFNFFEGFVLYLPWAVGYPLAIWILYAVGRLWNRRGPWGLVRAVTVFTIVIWLPVQTAFQSFQFRYFLPLLPIWCLMAGYAIEQCREEGLIPARIRRFGLVVTLIWLGGMSVLVVGLQRDAFGDITDAAFFISQRPQEERVFSNETYRAGVDAVKMSFWSGRPVLGYDPDRIQPGDLVAIHNVYGDLRRDLDRRFTFEVVYRSQRYLYPLLPDIMVWPPGTTSHPISMAFRFTPQVYQTEVVRITGTRGSTAPSP